MSEDLLDAETDSEALEALYRFYEHPNEQLYRLMDHLGGAAAGWSGRFKASASRG